ncbi:MAG: ribonuclease III [Bacteroidaceae bacterium]|nr:ribonuclease III [Bacteroidaceae bacterium]MBQ5694225.1 ribonuclease III [Bacteroidaceae bacterium]MBQ5838434.1 ribonuclease III [Bacteroidaceae bacterium]
MKAGNILDTIRLPFRKDRQLYRSFYNILGFYPRNIELYKQALTHRSVNHKNSEGKKYNNERLEYLGDAILGAVVGDILYRHFPGKKEGFLTNVRSRVVQRETLGRLADDMGLTELIQSNLMGKTHNSYMAGNAFEALIGAVYLDRGYEFCVKFVNVRILGKYINLEKIASKESNFKSRFLELCQKYRFEATFELLKETREEETLSPLFLSRVTIYGIECGRGSGYSKKESHQMAAKEALARLNRGGALYKKIVEKQNTIHNVTNSDNSTNICEQTQSIG